MLRTKVLLASLATLFAHSAVASPRECANRLMLKRQGTIDHTLSVGRSAGGEVVYAIKSGLVLSPISAEGAHAFIGRCLNPPTGVGPFTQIARDEAGRHVASITRFERPFATGDYEIAVPTRSIADVSRMGPRALPADAVFYVEGERTEIRVWDAPRAVPLFLRTLECLARHPWPGADGAS